MSRKNRYIKYVKSASGTTALPITAEGNNIFSIDYTIEYISVEECEKMAKQLADFSNTFFNILYDSFTT